MCVYTQYAVQVTLMIDDPFTLKCTYVHGVAFFINRWEAGIGWTLQVSVGMGHNIGQSSLKLWSTA